MLKDLLTIVIPCKNEGTNILDCLAAINEQKYIDGVTVVVADSSDVYPVFPQEVKSRLDVRIVYGGYPAEARAAGAFWVSTPYVLFLDADMFLLKNTLLIELMNRYYKRYDLITVPFTTDHDFDWCYRVFDIFQFIGHRFAKQPFAIGGFQLFRTDAYFAIGGYNLRQRFAEDYFISMKIAPEKFIVHKDGRNRFVYTSPRRLKNKGIWYMVKVMFFTFLNRKNPKWFEKSHGYWS